MLTCTLGMAQKWNDQKPQPIYINEAPQTAKDKKSADKPLQETIKLKKSAGDELIASTNNYYAGLALVLGGALVDVIGVQIAVANNNANASYNPNYPYYGPPPSTTNNTDNAVPEFVVGALLELTGAIFFIESREHIRRAGIIFNRNGLGLTIPVGK